MSCVSVAAAFRLDSYLDTRRNLQALADQNVVGSAAVPSFVAHCY